MYNGEKTRRDAFDKCTRFFPINDTHDRIRTKKNGAIDKASEDKEAGRNEQKQKKKKKEIASREL